MLIDCDQSQWSLSSVQFQPQPPRPLEDQQSSFGHTTLHQQYSYQSKHPPIHKPLILPDIPLHPAGKVMSVVEDFVVIDSMGNNQVIDLETYLLNKERQIIGYIVDVFGPVEHHYYAVKQEESHVGVGEEVYFVEGRVLKKEDIEKLKQVGKVREEEDGEDEQEEGDIKKMFKKRDREEMEGEREREDKGRKIKMKNNYHDNRNHHPQQQTQSQHSQSHWTPTYTPSPIFTQPQPQFTPTPNFYPQSQYPTPNFFPQSPFPNQYPTNNINMFSQFPNQQQQMMGNTPQLNQQGMFGQNPQDMRRLGQYYQNCYQQMMYNQKK